MIEQLQSVNAFEALLEKQRKNRWAVANTSVETRREKLTRLQNIFLAHQQEIRDALLKDLNRPEAEVDLSEIMLVNSEIKHTKKHLRSWLRPQRKGTPLSLFGTRARTVFEAKGNTLIISPWNFPVHLSFIPLVHAIAAGCCAIIKPSEMTPNAALVIKKIVESTFNDDEVAVVLGEVSTATALLKLPFDHIFFTGSPAIGKVVMKAAAENLTSVTLELGGKSPAVIDDSASVEKTAKRVVMGKFLNCGQTCIAPDYVLVHESQYSALVEHLKKVIGVFYGDTAEAQKNGNYTHIVNAHHFARLKRHFEDAILRGGQVLHGGEFDATQNFISPTIIGNVTDDMTLMQEEIFGPILPIKTYKNIEEAIEYINNKEKPLSFYIFSANNKNIDALLRGTSAGAVAINDALLQYLNPNIPFGGINSSGIGKAHGYYGFREFVNEKAVLKQLSPISAFELVYPPYTSRVKRVISLLIKWL